MEKSNLINSTIEAIIPIAIPASRIIMMLFFLEVLAVASVSIDKTDTSYFSLSLYAWLMIFPTFSDNSELYSIDTNSKLEGVNYFDENEIVCKLIIKK